MKGIEKMLKPLLGILEVSVPDAKPENEHSKFIEYLIIEFLPPDLPKELIRKFAVDAVNKNPDGFEKILRVLHMRIQQHLYSIEKP